MTFDPATFLNQEYTESLDTKIIPCPEGEFPGISEKIKVVPWQKKDGSSSGLKLELLWDIQDDNVRALCARDTVKVPQDIMLDLMEDGKSLDMGKGKNVGLGRLREALGLNTPGEPFSFQMLEGRMATCLVKHRAYEDNLFAEVKGVAKVA